MEEWRAVPDWPYEVSNLGAVRRQGGKPLKHVPATNGYMTVCFTDGPRRKTMMVHRLVCAAFHGLCPEGLEAAHGDGTKANCRADNLGWKTRTANAHDRVVHGTALLGERHPGAKLTEAQVREIRASSGRCVDVGAVYGVCAMVVSKIRRRRAWAHLP